MFSSIPDPFLVLLSFLGRSVWHFWLVLYLNYSTSLISVFLGLILHIMWFGHIFALYNFEAQDFLLYLYSIESAICRPSNSTVGRPRRAEIRTRDGRLYRICFLPLYVHFTPQVFVYVLVYMLVSKLFSDECIYLKFFPPPTSFSCSLPIPPHFTMHGWTKRSIGKSAIKFPNVIYMPAVPSTVPV